MPEPPRTEAARRGPVPGLEDVPLSYGDPDRELDRLEACGIADLTVHGVLRVEGEGTRGFLQDVVAGPLGGLEPGDRAPTLLLDADGKIDAAGHAWVREEGVVDLLLEAPGLDRARGELKDYARFSDAQVEERDAALLHVAGAGAGDVLADVLAAPDDGVVEGGEAALAPGGLGSGPGYIVQAEPGAVDALWTRIADAAEAAGGGPVGWRALEDRRVRAGVPRLGADVGPDRFPQEVGMMAGVALEKGCFVGQETVARIENRGQVNRRLVRVRGLEGPLTPGTTLRSAGDVGEVTSVADVGKVHEALALVRREVAEPGSRLASSGGPVDVVGEASWTPAAVPPAG